MADSWLNGKVLCVEKNWETENYFSYEEIKWKVWQLKENSGSKISFPFLTFNGLRLRQKKDYLWNLIRIAQQHLNWKISNIPSLLIIDTLIHPSLNRTLIATSRRDLQLGIQRREPPLSNGIECNSPRLCICLKKCDDNWGEHFHQCSI